MTRMAEQSAISDPGARVTHEEAVRTDIPPDESVTAAVFEALEHADLLEDDEQTKLNHVVDPDALDRLFSSRTNGVAREGGFLTFQYNDATVTVTSDAVAVTPEATDDTGSTTAAETADGVTASDE